MVPQEALAAMPESLIRWWQLHCCVQALQPSMHCDIAAPRREDTGGDTRGWRVGTSGIQFASKFGYRVVAISRGQDSAALAKKLGAALYIDSKASKVADELQKLGGARVILATAPNARAMSELIDGLGVNGKMVIVGASADPIEVSPLQLIMARKNIQGWAAGTPSDSEDTLRFSEMTGVLPMIEKYPLEKAAEGYARMISGKAQFRVVLTM